MDDPTKAAIYFSEVDVISRYTIYYTYIDSDTYINNKHILFILRRYIILCKILTTTLDRSENPCRNWLYEFPIIQGEPNKMFKKILPKKKPRFRLHAHNYSEPLLGINKYTFLLKKYTTYCYLCPNQYYSWGTNSNYTELVNIGTEWGT